MSKQFTVVYREGEGKFLWLMKGGKVPMCGSDGEYPYMGSAEIGTTVGESEVREVRQHRHKDDPKDAFFTLNDNTLWLWEHREEHRDIEFRTAYTDAEPPDIDYEKEMPHKQWPSTKYVAREVGGDRHASDNPRYPLFYHMSSEHGLTLLDSELDEIARHAAPMTGVDYWKRRCKIAESMMGMCPSDPKTYDEFCRLYDEWEQIIEEGRAYGN